MEEGGGLLAIGEGWSWLGSGSTFQDDPSRSVLLENYPMNRLMAPFGARWTEKTIDVNSLK